MEKRGRNPRLCETFFPCSGKIVFDARDKKVSLQTPKALPDEGSVSVRLPPCVKFLGHSGKNKLSLNEGSDPR